uniref:MICOS complex subunit MIC10 n=1 Tax=Strigamia maritima TaxID=126957 RepID=T1JLT9_STRMM
MDKCEKVPKLQRFRSEEEFAQTWDRCLTDMVVKMGGGVGLGIVFSLFLFGRRGWPIYFGMGSGFGIAYNNCQSAFNGALQTHQLRPRCSPHIQLAKRRCDKIEDICKRGGSQAVVAACVDEPAAPVQVVKPCQPAPTPQVVIELAPQEVPACASEMPKREEPWTCHNSYGQVTQPGIYNATRPHFNTVGSQLITPPPCPPADCPSTCDPCPTNPRDNCRFKNRICRISREMSNLMTLRTWLLLFQHAMKNVEVITHKYPHACPQPGVQR